MALEESSVIPTKPHLAEHAHVSGIDAYRERYAASIADPAEFWRAQAKEFLTWFHPPHATVHADMERAEFAWFPGGKLNASFLCVDRHAAKTPDKTAIIWVGNEPGEYRHISFAELAREVGRMANVLQAHGVGKGDRVCIYLPMIPELAITMLACARIGAVHSVVFAGFSAEALRDRVLDASCKLLVTADEGLRGPKHIHLKDIVDRALSGIACVETVLVARRTGGHVAMTQGRDLWLDEELARQRATCPCAWVDSEDPLFVLYTSGSTGKPKGVLHTTAGYLLYAACTHKYAFDVHADDVFFCAADAGWITGHSYIVYGPLANGVTTVMFESVPTYPDAGRYWQVIDDIGATIFYTAPTAIRAIMREGDEPVRKYSRKSLRVLGSVGEPINPEVWRWYHDVVGEGRCAVVDTWWQTETGGILITPLPGATPTKPGSATLPFFGILPLLLDDDGRELTGNDVTGNLCIAAPWPGQTRTLYGDHARFHATYYARFPGHYFTGDGCHRDADGYYWITGRVDDVINVSGHRLGTAEIESALVAHPAVAEAAVVGYPHELKGTGIHAYVIALPGHGDELVEALRAQVREAISPIATPDRIQVVAGLPKTRSGKIMRRILRKIAAGDLHDLGDISTLADPTVVEDLIRGR
ncbi:MAG: acetate--CoA ligase [Nannocystaceae bacterium]